MFGFIIFAGIALAAFWGLVFVVLIVAAAINIPQNQNKIADNERLLRDQFGEGDYFYSLYGPSCIGVSFEKELIVIGTEPDKVASYPFAALRESSIKVDNTTVTKTTAVTSTGQGSKVMGAAAGAALFGPLGLLAGGLAGGKHKTVSKAVEQRLVRTVKLVIRVNDHIMPLHTAFFLKLNSKGYSADNEVLLGPVMKKAAHYHALLTNVIDGNKVVEKIGRTG